MIQNPHRLLQDLRAGSPAARETLAVEAMRIGLRTASAMLGNRDLAGDVAQETAIDVLRGAERLRSPEALETWIHRIAVRKTMREVRRTRAQLLREVSLGQLPEVYEPVAEGELPHDTAEREALRRAVRSAIQLVPERQRMALVLRYVHDLSQEQIAAALGVRLGTAGALLSRGRELLRTSRTLDEYSSAPRGGDA